VVEVVDDGAVFVGAVHVAVGAEVPAGEMTGAPRYLREAVRLGLFHYNTADEVQATLAALAT
jgi:hypothetical protein